MTQTTRQEDSTNPPFGQAQKLPHISGGDKHGELTGHIVIPVKLGLPDWRAREAAYSRKAYWRCAKHASVNMAISSKRLAQAGYYSILDRYESLHLCD